MKNYFVFFLFISSLHLNAQWSLINDVGGEPNSSASLEIDANDKGILIPRMGILEREAIANPAEGLLVYQNDSTIGFYYYKNTEWVIIDGKTVTNSTNNAKIAIISDIKSSGTDGGGFVSGSWEIRDLNDIKGDTSFVSIDSITTFTLDSGLYEISALAPARGVNQHQVRLFNITDGTVDATGVAMQSELADPPSKLITVLKINSQKVFRLEHRCTTTNSATNARGTAINWGENVYSWVRIQQL